MSNPDTSHRAETLLEELLAMAGPLDPVAASIDVPAFMRARTTAELTAMIARFQALPLDEWARVRLEVDGTAGALRSMIAC